MAVAPPRLIPAQRAALNVFLELVYRKLRALLDDWHIDDHARARVAAWYEEYLAADEERQKAMGAEAQQEWQRQQDEEPLEGLVSEGSLLKDLRTLRRHLDEIGFALEAEAINVAIGEFESQSLVVPTDDLRSLSEKTFLVVDELLAECGSQSPTAAFRSPDDFLARVSAAVTKVGKAQDELLEIARVKRAGGYENDMICSMVRGEKCNSTRRRTSSTRLS